MRSAVFHPEAEEEFIAAARFYEQHSEGLGREFIAEVRHTVRRMMVDRFPYAVLYRREVERILLVAVMSRTWAAGRRSAARRYAAEACRILNPGPRQERGGLMNEKLKARLERSFELTLDLVAHLDETALGFRLAKLAVQPDRGSGLVHRRRTRELH